MCYTVEYVEQRAARIAERFKKLFPTDSAPAIPAKLPLFYLVSGFEHPQLPVVTLDGIFLYEWGLIPSWIKDTERAKEFQNITLNAVGETVFEKPSFKKSVVSQRCLVPVNGFYEWRDFNKKKYPYLIQLKDSEIFSLGGIYENWTDVHTGELKHTFSLLTTPANALMETIHNTKKRMPLIIAEEDEKKWIDPHLKHQEISELIKPYPENNMQAYTISQFANSTRNERNVAEILNPVEYPELSNNLFA